VCTLLRKGESYPFLLFEAGGNLGEMRIVCSGKVNYKQDWSYVRPLNFLTLVRVLGSADEVGFLFRPTPVRVDGEDRVFTHMAGWAAYLTRGRATCRRKLAH